MGSRLFSAVLSIVMKEGRQAAGGAVSPFYLFI